LLAGGGMAGGGGQVILRSGNASLVRRRLGR
jgi:hypothetical protein